MICLLHQQENSSSIVLSNQKEPFYIRVGERV